MIDLLKEVEAAGEKSYVLDMALACPAASYMRGLCGEGRFRSGSLSNPNQRKCEQKKKAGDNEGQGVSTWGTASRVQLPRTAAGSMTGSHSSWKRSTPACVRGSHGMAVALSPYNGDVIGEIVRSHIGFDGFLVSDDLAGGIRRFRKPLGGGVVGHADPCLRPDSGPGRVTA